MGAIQVSLTDDQSDLVDRLVRDGRYKSAADAVRAGLSLLEDDERARHRLRARLLESLEQARSGNLAEGDGETAMHRAFAAGDEAWRRRNTGA